MCRLINALNVSGPRRTVLMDANDSIGQLPAFSRVFREVSQDLNRLCGVYLVKVVSTGLFGGIEQIRTTRAGLNGGSPGIGLALKLALKSMTSWLSPAKGLRKPSGEIL